MKRRDFITLLGGAVAWPLATRAQQAQRMRRVGVLMSTAADDAEGRARIAAFLGELQKLGWIDGRCGASWLSCGRPCPSEEQSFRALPRL